MAIKTLYFKNATPTGASTSRSIQDGGTPPNTGTTATGWVVGTRTTPNYSIATFGTKNVAASFTTTDQLTGTFVASSCWRSESTLNGTFANTNWTLNFRVRSGSVASSQTGQVRARIWRSANADGSGATELTSATQAGTTTSALTATPTTSTVTWSPGGTVTLTNEYLWVQCEWFIVGTSGSGTADVIFNSDPNATLLTSDFSPAPATGTFAAIEASDTAGFQVTVLSIPRIEVSWVELRSLVADGSATGTLAATEAADTFAAAGHTVITGTLGVTEASDAFAATGLLSLSATLSAVETADTFAATGEVSATGTFAAAEDSDTADFWGSVLLIARIKVTWAELKSSVGAGSATGTLAATEAADTFAATGYLPINAVLGATEVSDIASFTGAVVSGQRTFVKHIGVWKPATTYVKHAGVWKLPVAKYVKDAGTWKSI